MAQARGGRHQLTSFVVVHGAVVFVLSVFVLPVFVLSVFVLSVFVRDPPCDAAIVLTCVVLL